MGNLPENFNWEFYLNYYKDLRMAGIKTEDDAKKHYLRHGHNEGRIYKETVIERNYKFKDSSVFIFGTSPEIEILKDGLLVKKIEDNFKVLCINSSFHYFKKIDCLFLNGRFQNFGDSDFSNKLIDEIYIGRNSFIKNYKIINFCLKRSSNFFLDEIKTDLNGCLPHGPTTLLDIVFPFCVYNEVKNIYILGAEYNQNLDLRHKDDSIYINRNQPRMDKELELQFAKKKLVTWKNYFETNNINCFALSYNSQTPFEKKSLESVFENYGIL